MRDSRDSPFAVRRSRGFTLIELLVVLAILAVVSGVLTLIFYQLSNVPRWGNAQLAVDSDLRNAGLWLMRDGNEAWSFTPGVSPIYGAFAITRTGNTTATATYRYDGGTLWRDYATASATTTKGVARHVAQASDAAFTSSGGIVVVEITATSGQGKNRVTATQRYTVTMRAR